jgi:spore maturation protein CgeB
MTKSILFFGDLSHPWTRSYARLEALKNELPSANIKTRNWNSKTRIGRFLLKVYFKLQLPILAPFYLLWGTRLSERHLIWVDNFPLFPPLYITLLKIVHPTLKVILVSEDNFLLPHNHIRLHRCSLPYYDCIFTTKTYVMDRMMKQASIYQILDSFDERLNSTAKEDKHNYCYDVSFIGTFENDRFMHLNYLCAHGIDVHIFGNGWPQSISKNMHIHKPVYGKDFKTIACSSRINLVFLRRQNFDEITSRSYEIPSFSVFFLAEKSPKHRKLYQNEELLFNNSVALLERVQHWLRRTDHQRELLGKTLYDSIAIPENSIGRQVAHILQNSGIDI